jgi:hypothetical protein
MEPMPKNKGSDRRKKAEEDRVMLSICLQTNHGIHVKIQGVRYEEGSRRR